MHKIFKVIHGLAREHIVKIIKRSPDWPMVRNSFLRKHPTCAACGGKSLLNVHHIIPFHIDKNLELDEKNLITLCIKNLCHIEIGHGGNYKHYVKNVIKYSAMLLKEPQKRKDIELLCKNEALEIAAAAGNNAS